MSAEYFLHPVTVHFIVPSRRKNSERTRDTFSGKCRNIVPFSQPQCIDQECFRALFRIPMTLQPPLPILLYMCGSLKYSHPFRKTLPWQFLRTFLSPALACLSLRAHALRKPIMLLQALCCKNFVLKFFCRTSTLQKIFNTKIYPTKISRLTVHAPMHTDAKDVVFLTWELINIVCACNIGWVKKVHCVYKDLLLWPYITMVSFIMIELMIHAAFLLCTMIPPCMKNQMYWASYSTHGQFMLSICWSLKNVNEIHSQFCDKCTGIYLWGKGHNSFPCIRVSCWRTFTLDVE